MAEVKSSPEDDEDRDLTPLQVAERRYASALEVIGFLDDEWKPFRSSVAPYRFFWVKFHQGELADIQTMTTDQHTAYDDAVDLEDEDLDGT